MASSDDSTIIASLATFPSARLCSRRDSASASSRVTAGAKRDKLLFRMKSCAPERIRSKPTFSGAVPETSMNGISNPLSCRTLSASGPLKLGIL